jgi:hypothetical protein
MAPTDLGRENAVAAEMPKATRDCSKDVNWWGFLMAGMWLLMAGIKGINGIGCYF